MAHVFAGLGKNGRKLHLYEADRKTRVRQVLWGDYLEVEGEEADGWLRIRWSPRNNPRTLFIKKTDTTAVRPLEIIFLDVGQGDGAVLVTPEMGEREGIIVIDAGEADNMARFLNGRFRAYRGFDFDAAVITHPDEDHYRGFEALFAHPNVGFRRVWQNGLVERAVSGGWEKLGPLEEDPATGVSYLVELGETEADVRRLLPDPAENERFGFPRLLQRAMDNPRIGEIAMLSTAHGAAEAGRTYVPGYAPSDGRDYAIEVLGPVVERDAAGRARLRKIGAAHGKTKNGHSILLRLTYGQFSVFFGGDLNAPAEEFLLAHYGGLTAFPSEDDPAHDEMIEKVAGRFRSDVMKVCHHGAEDVTDAFMYAVRPACFVISSGDKEGHVHPRPDLLGRLGRAGRGASPVLLSTELQRSTREKADLELIGKLGKAVEDLAVNATPEKLRAIKAQLKTLSHHNVDVYGAIYLKTDGERLITAFKIEAKSEKEMWFYYEYRFRNGELVLVR